MDLPQVLRRWSDVATWASVLPRRSVVPAATVELSAGDDETFVQYLLSDESRLPTRPEFATTTAAPEDYDTLVGEDDWVGAATQSTAPPVPSFDAYVDQLVDAVRTLRARAPAVVVCGAYGTLDDAGWAVPSDGLRCFNVLDVMTVLRSSTKFTRDLRWQCAEPITRPHVTVRAWVDIESGVELRAFIERGRVVGITQRSVDQVFDHLALMDDNELAAWHDECERFLLDHVVAPVSASEAEGEPTAAAAEWLAAPSLIVDFVHPGSVGATLPIVVLGVRAMVELTVHVDAFGTPSASAFTSQVHASSEDDVCRVFRNVAELRRWTDTRRVRVARDGGDLFADHRLIGRGSMPLEFQDPGLLAQLEAVGALRDIIAKTRET